MTDPPYPRLELNVPGTFYTTGECMACEANEDEAPELFALLEGENYDTYFVRQPATPAEVEHACRAAEACCVNAVRYGGTDPEVIRRLGNSPAYCDHPGRAGTGHLASGGTSEAGAVAKARRAWWAFWRR